MKDRARRCLILAGALGALAGGAAAQDDRQNGRLAVTGKVGTIGPGVDLTYGWSRDLHARVSLNYDPDEDRTGKEQIRAAGSLLLDWHPGGGAFRFSGGLAVVRKEFNGLSPTESLSVRSGSNSLSSYLGLGWGNPLRPGSRWSFSVDLGAFGGGGISYSTAPEDSASPSAARESRDSGRLRVRSTWEPVVSTGLSYRF